MKYNIYDPVTYLYVETVEADVAPAHSVPGDLPEETEYYKIAYINGVWVSVINPKYKVVDDKLVPVNPPQE